MGGYSWPIASSNIIAPWLTSSSLSTWSCSCVAMTTLAMAQWLPSSFSLFFVKQWHLLGNPLVLQVSPLMYSNKSSSFLYAQQETSFHSQHYIYVLPALWVCHCWVQQWLQWDPDCLRRVCDFDLLLSLFFSILVPITHPFKDILDCLLVNSPSSMEIIGYGIQVAFCRFIVLNYVRDFDGNANLFMRGKEHTQPFPFFDW